MKYVGLIVLFVSSAALASGAFAQKLHYPQTKKVDHVDTYFGTKVVDPYRWLENVDSSDVHEWVKEENDVTNAYLAKIPYREKLRARIEKLLNYPRIGAPHKVGEYYFFSKNDGLQNQSVIYRQRGLDGAPEVFLNPNSLEKDGTASLGGIEYSNDDKYAAYTVHHSGSDWQEIFVKEVATGKQLDDHLKWCRYTSASWYKNGFYYGRFDEPKGGQYTAASDFQKIYYHALGTPQSADSLVYWDSANAQHQFSIGISEDEKYLFLYQNEGGKIGSLIWWRHADNPAEKLTPLISEYGHMAGVIDNIGD